MITGVEFILWHRPPDDHALMARADVSVCCIAHVDAVDFFKPPGAPDYTTSNAVNCGKRLADWAQWQGMTVGSRRTPGTDGAWLVMLNLGTSTQGASYTIQRNAADAVPSAAGIDALYNATGCDTGAGTAHDFTADAMASYNAERLARNLRPPRGSPNDHEERSRVEQQCKTTSPADPDGIFPETLAAARAAIEVLCRDGPLSSPANKTLDDLLIDYDYASLTPDFTQEFFRDVNKPFSRIFQAIESRVIDDALYRAIYAPAKAVFPSMRWGNFDVQNPVSAASPFYDANDPWLYFNHRGGSDNMRADFQHVPLYGPNMAPGPDNYAPEANASHGLGTTKREVWRNFILRQLRACTANNNSKPIIPTIETPGTNASNNSINHVPTSDDILWLLGRCYAAGVREFLIFNPDMTGNTAQADDLQRTLEHFTGQSFRQDTRRLQVRLNPADGNAVQRTLLSIGSNVEPTPTVVVTHDAEGATAENTVRFRIQVKDEIQQDWAGRWPVRFYITDTEDGDPSAAGNTVVFRTGTMTHTVLAGADYEALTDRKGLIEVDLTISGAGTRFVYAMTLKKPLPSPEADYA